MSGLVGIADHERPIEMDNMGIVSKLVDILSPDERRRAGFLLCMILVMALLDVIGVASILPFVAVLTNPQLMETNTILAATYVSMGFSSPHDFLFFLGLLVLVALVVSLAFKALTTYAQLRFTLMREYSIGRRLVESYLCQPYARFLDRHSADLGNTVLSEVRTVIGSAILPLLTIAAQGAVVIAILALLVAVDTKLALTVGAVLALAYGLIYRAVSGFLGRIGEERMQSSKKRFLVVNEAFGAIKEVKIGGLEQVYLRRFSDPAEIYARHQASAQAVGQLPRFALEAVAFGGMLLIMLYQMSGTGEGVAATMPMVALYAFAGYRLMPALQQVYGSISQLRFAAPALDALHADLTELTLRPRTKMAQQSASLALNRSIEINSICYTYPNSQHPALSNFSLSIPARSTVGLVGTTGSGKTTAVDLLIGLLEPQRGSVEIDGVTIDAENRHRWQRLIGYVPQQIYLSDDSLAANIAFGLGADEIDFAAVERAARIANLHEFVSNELPSGYATVVGERGVRLSGGQRQRVGIARALYHGPKLLVLDEATSALDNLTEQAVMEAVRNLGHSITIVLIAHRLTTVRECDRIVLLHKGSVAAIGTYHELLEQSETFRAMTGVEDLRTSVPESSKQS